MLGGHKADMLHRAPNTVTSNEAQEREKSKEKPLQPRQVSRLQLEMTFGGSCLIAFVFVFRVGSGAFRG